jgi:hypothetical protein
MRRSSRSGRGWRGAWRSFRDAIDDVDIHSTDVVVSSHACGALTDLVLNLAVAARARVAVLPCRHDLAAGTPAGCRMGRRSCGHRHRAGDAPDAAGLPHLDAGHSGRHHLKNRLLLGAPETDGALARRSIPSKPSSPTSIGACKP